MTRSGARLFRRLGALVGASAILAALLTLSASVGSCILADPPAELPDAETLPLRIVRETTIPPVYQILRTWPETNAFEVAVEVDPGATISAGGFIDYDILSNRSSLTKTVGPITPDPAGTDAGVRIIDVTFSGQPDLAGCHTVQIIVQVGNAVTHTFIPGAGDSVLWFYSGSGSLDGCPAWTQGINGVDAAADAGEGGG